MNGSVYSRGISDVWQRESEGNSDLLLSVSMRRRNLMHDSENWLTVFCGMNYMDTWTDSEIYALMLLESDANKGRLLFSTVHLGYSPTSDKQIAENQRNLDAGLFNASRMVSSVEGKSVRLSSVVQNGCGDYDGVFYWTGNLCFQTVGENCQFRSIYLPCPNGGVALEIGDQAFSKTLVYMRLSGGYPMGFLARWPYGCDFLHIGYMLPD
jgi:hypothetical protein